jgi:hypothetical protein
MTTPALKGFPLAMLLFGIGPGLCLDLEAFIFQVPNSDSSWACASTVPASNSAPEDRRSAPIRSFVEDRQVLVWHVQARDETAGRLPEEHFSRDIAAWGKSEAPALTIRTGG